MGTRSHGAQAPLTTLRLSRESLSIIALKASAGGAVLKPRRAGIVHLGLGNFHRAHMARYTDILLQQGVGADWGILGAGLLADDEAVRDVLAPQDWLYTLVERDGSEETARVIGSLCGMVLAHHDAAALLAAIDAPGVRIVSLTVTERGYCINPATKRLDLDHPIIRADLAKPEDPRSAIGVLVAALARRRALARPAFTALSCDNIQHNGDVLRAAVQDYAGLFDPSLLRWIDGHACFPNTMVDRITPSTSFVEIDGFAERFGYVDAAPVFCEPFTQWVIEDEFADGRPDWDQAGAQFVADVTPYERMKLRLLNASHFALAAIGSLVGFVYVDEAARDPDMVQYIASLMDLETGPTVETPPGINLAAYKASVIKRFGNPRVKDTLSRINSDAPMNYVLDPIRDRIARSLRVERLALAVAARLACDALQAGIDRNFVPRIGQLHAAARERLVFGDMLDDPAFVTPVNKWIDEANLAGVRLPSTWASLLCRTS